MDKVALSSVVSKAPNDIVGLMVMRKAMNTAKQDGQNKVNLLSSALPHLGKNIDIKI